MLHNKLDFSDIPSPSLHKGLLIYHVIMPQKANRSNVNFLAFWCEIENYLTMLSMHQSPHSCLIYFFLRFLTLSWDATVVLRVFHPAVL
jgi:hypothetical protein